MSFNFTREPPHAVVKDIQSIDKFTADQFSAIFQLGIDIILDPSKAPSVQSELTDFGTENNVNVSALKNIFKSLLTVLNGAVRRNVSSSEIKDDMLKLGLSNEKAENAENKWSQNIAGISRTALDQTLMVNQLADMEWKFGVTASSSELNQVGNTFLQLKLVINKGNKMENVYIELTLPQFYSFLHEMEKAKASLEYFS